MDSIDETHETLNTRWCECLKDYRDECPCDGPPDPPNLCEPYPLVSQPRENGE